MAQWHWRSAAQSFSAPGLDTVWKLQQPMHTKNQPRLAAAVRHALSSAMGIAHGRPMGLGAVLAAVSMSFATCASAANTYFVTTAGDPGPGGTVSLRQAIAAANAAPDNTV